jgi:F-type H+-transporting ATPase subunit b
MDTLLNPDPGIYVWTIVSFLGLVALLRAFAWKPLLSAIESREAAMRREREGAEAARRQAEDIRAELAGRMEGLSAQARQVLEEAGREGRRLREQMRLDAEAEAGRVLDKARAQLEEEKRRLVSELRREVADLSVEAAEKLIERSVDPGVRKAVLDRFLSDISRRGAGNRG